MSTTAGGDKLHATEEHALELDAVDPLREFRAEFHIPEAIIYLDGNSLGLASRRSEEAVLRALREWKSLGVRGWLEADPPWFELAERLGARLAPMIGAEPEEVIITGSTTVNLHQLVATFYEPRGARSVLVADELNFPSDIYALQSQLRLHHDDYASWLKLVKSRDGRTLEEADLEAAFTTETALAILPTVLYRSGQLLDIDRLTAAAHRKGVIIGFDCSHSVGVIPHHLAASDVDFAFWCSYKYLNGGPGATAGLYLNRRHLGAVPGLAGWWGNNKATQFDMRLTHDPAPEAGAMQLGTPPILATVGLLGALELIAEAGIERLRAKSLRLTEYLIYLADCELAQFGFSIGTPREPHRRGGHVALEHPRLALRVNQALKSRGVVADFRPPDIIRLAPVPLYNTFHEVWRVVQTIKEIVSTDEYENFENQRDPVT